MQALVAAQYAQMHLNLRLADFTDRLRAANASNELVGAFVISPMHEIAGMWADMGHIDSVTLPIEHIVMLGQRSASSQIMLVHTHPSGDPRPSRQDMIATKRLRADLMAYNIRLCDHIILAENRYFSFRRNGLL